MNERKNGENELKMWTFFNCKVNGNLCRMSLECFFFFLPSDLSAFHDGALNFPLFGRKRMVRFMVHLSLLKEHNSRQTIELCSTLGCRWMIHVSQRLSLVLGGEKVYGVKGNVCGSCAMVMTNICCYQKHIHCQIQPSLSRTHKSSFSFFPLSHLRSPGEKLFCVYSIMLAHYFAMTIGA